MADAIRVPEPLSSDIDDVTDALDVAQSLWENGKKVDAIQWVKRAAQSAKADPNRMASLARAAEDLERAAAPRAATPPPVPVSKPPPVPPPVPKVSKPPPPVPAARTAPSVPPPAPQAAVIPPPAPTPRPVPSVKPAAPPSTQTKISIPPAPAGPVVPTMVARPSKVPPQLLQQPPASEDRVRLAPAPSDNTLRVRASVRVSVKTSVRDGSLLVVRPLADGAAVPAGTREALLTFVNDDVDDVGASTG